MSTTKNISEKKLKNQLQKILKENPNTIKACFIQEALNSCTIYGFFHDLLNYGCVSGMIGSLIYYHDTAKFFDTHYEEIIWLKTEFEESTGQAIVIPHQVKNHLSWFATEQTAYQLVNEIGLEI
jgi:hypothetical protein